MMAKDPYQEWLSLTSGRLASLGTCRVLGIGALERIWLQKLTRQLQLSLLLTCIYKASWRLGSTSQCNGFILKLAPTLRRQRLKYLSLISKSLTATPGRVVSTSQLRPIHGNFRLTQIGVGRIASGECCSTSSEKDNHLVNTVRSNTEAQTDANWNSLARVSQTTRPHGKQISWKALTTQSRFFLSSVSVERPHHLTKLWAEERTVQKTKQYLPQLTTQTFNDKLSLLL